MIFVGRDNGKTDSPRCTTALSEFSRLRLPAKTIVNSLQILKNNENSKAWGLGTNNFARLLDLLHTLEIID